MPDASTPPDDESKEVYDLDLDEDAGDQDSIMREAVEHIEQSEDVTDSDEAKVASVKKSTADDPVVPADGPSEVSHLEQQIDELRERNLRALADYENYRKRSERERAEAKRFAIAEPIREFLDVVDNLERALEIPSSGDDLKIGVEMIHRQMVDLLRRHGAEEVSAVGEVFDPAFHEAVARHEDSSADEPIVTDELQRGYTLHGRLLRPARVRVAMPASSQMATEETDDGARSQSTNGARGDEEDDNPVKDQSGEEADNGGEHQR